VRKEVPRNELAVDNVAGPFLSSSTARVGQGRRRRKGICLCYSRNIGSENEQPVGFAAPGLRFMGQSPEVM